MWAIVTFTVAVCANAFQMDETDTRARKVMLFVIATTFATAAVTFLFFWGIWSAPGSDTPEVAESPATAAVGPSVHTRVQAEKKAVQAKTIPQRLLRLLRFPRIKEDSSNTTSEKSV
jgi:hypothetical protein